MVGRVYRYGQISKDIIAHHEEGLIRIQPSQFSVQSYLIRLPMVCCVVWLWLMIVYGECLSTLVNLRWLGGNWQLVRVVIVVVVCWHHCSHWWCLFVSLWWWLVSFSCQQRISNVFQRRDVWLWVHVTPVRDKDITIWFYRLFGIMLSKFYSWAESKPTRIQPKFEYGPSSKLGRSYRIQA